MKLAPASHPALSRRTSKAVKGLRDAAVPAGAWLAALALMPGASMAQGTTPAAGAGASKASSASRGAPPAPAPALASVSSEMQRKTLLVGSQQELVFGAGVERIAIADEAIAAVAVTRQQASSPAARLILTGKAPGATTLMVWEKGRLSAHRYELQVERRSATLSGSFPDAQAHTEARERALAGYADKTVLADRSVVDVRSHTVQVDVKVVEFNRSTLKQVGINLFSTRRSHLGQNHGFSFGVYTPSSLSKAVFGADGSITDTEFTRPIAQAFGLLLNSGKLGVGADISLLEGNGLARVLAEPTLVAMSGQSASFLAGGELPIPVPQGLGTTSIEYKQFGIGLTVTPTVLSDSRIGLKVAPEASELDYANATSFNGAAVPAITTRRADTTVELGDGESFIIGGLVSRQTSSNVEKLPLLGDLPVLGSFFRRNNYQQSEKELVIVVTPHLVRPIARGTDLNAYLPGQNEQRDAPVWRQILSGGASDAVVPGFSQ